ncbi:MULTISPECIES: Crp/Fnr family transcriptional regulator [Cupriavidus]|uniref:Crp/Fnr family transcriptional regulator n=1 Tax=Cupriavidus TaxID=106589 RepID=UPI00037985ED|nr:MULTISPECIES: Crp/Fnr family transcriptional regulator [Cupriavidus]
MLNQFTSPLHWHGLGAAAGADHAPEAARLARLPLFRGLEPALLDELALAARSCRLPKGGVLFGRGEPCKGLHIVAEGMVKLALPVMPGREKAIEVFGPGAVFGEAVMFLDAPYLVECRALARSAVIRIDTAAMQRAIARAPELSARLLRNLSARLVTLMRDIEGVSLRCALQRVAEFLLQQAGESGRTWLACTQRVIASKLGLSPETLSRAMRTLAGERLLRLERGKIHLLDVDGLRLRSRAAG